jgi:hypothetical protein
MAGLFTAAAGELARYKLDLVGLQEVRWDKRGTEQGDIIYSMEEETKIINWKKDFFLYTTE